MQSIRTGLLALALTACSGGTTPDAGPAPTPAAEPEPAAEPAPPSEDDTIDKIEDYAEKLAMNLNELEEFTAEPFSEGDFERVTRGYKKGGELLYIMELHSVGEYGQTTMTYVLKGDALIHWTRSGFAHDPTDDNDMRFDYFDEQVVMDVDGTVLRSRRRHKHADGSGMGIRLGDAPWADVGPPMEHIDLAGVVGRLTD